MTHAAGNRLRIRRLKVGQAHQLGAEAILNSPDGWVSEMANMGTGRMLLERLVRKVASEVSLAIRLPHI